MNILYVISGETKFKKNDEIILSDIGELKKNKHVNMEELLKSKKFKTFNLVRLYFYLVCIFSCNSLHAIKSDLQKKVYIIAGGYDVASVPEIKYGSMISGFRRKMGQYILKHAHKVIAVSKSNRGEIIKNCKIHPKRIKLIYNAIKLENTQCVYRKKTKS